MYEFECLTDEELNNVEAETESESCSPLSGMCYPDTRCNPGDEY